MTKTDQPDRKPGSDGPAECDGGEIGEAVTTSVWRRHLPHIFGLVLMVAAIVVVQREIRHLSLTEVAGALKAIPHSALMAAGGCTVLSYFILSFYDRLAVIQAGYPKIGLLKTSFAAFCSYVLSHNLGFSAISGAAVRFRLYRNWGLPPLAIAQIIAFCSATYLLGAAALIGGVLLAEPHALPLIGDHLSPLLLRLAGGALWGGVLAYILAGIRWRSITIRGNRIDLPSPLMALAQTVVSAAEVAATASIPYVLLPLGTVGFGTFLAIYIASYTAGLVASVPGGLGVFDGTMLVALGPYLPAPRILGIILVFRLFYYIGPLFLAGGMFAGHELFLRGDAAMHPEEEAAAVAAKAEGRDAPRPRRPSGAVRESEAGFSVTVATGAVALCGLMLLTLPIMNPLEFAADSGLTATGLAGGDYLLSLAGALLIALALGLAQRVTLTWSATIAVLLATAVATFLRGNMMLVPAVLAFTAFLIAPFRKCYYRHARILSEPLSPATVGSLMFLLCCGLVIITHKMPGTWWEMLSFSGEGDRHWLVVITILLSLLVLARLMRAGRVRTQPWTEERRAWYETLDHAHLSFPGLAPEALITGQAAQAAVPVRRRSGFLVGLGDPAGESADCATVIWQLRDLAIQEGLQPAFRGAGTIFQNVYDDLGLVSWPMPDGTLLFCPPEQSGLVRARLEARGTPECADRQQRPDSHV
ncbi:lysylphosphatidylglycerol synthetase family protein [Acetobacter sp. AN02]|uniref:lysylphosphatidylglycerol synthetase family protein n=1 Tax=Acetobacter sp. AN02 TaxID=2894186 RepID=UPI0024341908|nr:lysylphosphatidylglycerol synthetase family protein [Acetobacter sp. AN02]MDG6093563.1 lysylphosphatidylglycerol synthetase family protein [Acetobacter sp. AN02]